MATVNHQGIKAADLPKLSEFFAPYEIEWRIGRCGKGKTGDIWAMALAYVDDRAIMERLDSVCGGNNWRNEFEPHPMGPEHGCLCGLSILIDGEWLTKWDTGGTRDTETSKSAISDSEKRAACKWGVGRYLYELEEGFVEVRIATNNEHGKELAKQGYDRFGKTKEGDYFRWKPPAMPRKFWPPSYSPPSVLSKIKTTKDLLRTAIISRNLEQLKQIISIPLHSEDFSAKDVAELQTFIRDEMVARLPDGKIPDLARLLLNDELIRADDFRAVEIRVEELLKGEIG